MNLNQSIYICTLNKTLYIINNTLCNEDKMILHPFKIYLICIIIISFFMFINCTCLLYSYINDKVVEYIKDRIKKNDIKEVNNYFIKEDRKNTLFDNTNNNSELLINIENIVDDYDYDNELTLDKFRKEFSIDDFNKEVKIFDEFIDEINLKKIKIYNIEENNDKDKNI